MILNTNRYGVIWSPTKNIGDDIQTIAAIDFLKKKGIVEYELLNREFLHLYTGPEINVIMNGWFMHKPKNFPPSNKIKPIWISFHVAKPRIVSENLAYFKQQPPIGCRDTATVDLLRSYGIDSYFTGCLTMCFDEYENKNSKKYIVDVNTKCYYIPNVDIDLKLFSDFKCVEHDNVYVISDEFKQWKRYDPENRLNFANKLLNKYKKAYLVITTRLHCTLPCRAFKTDCIFIHKNYQTDPRFTGLKQILNGDSVYHNNKKIKTENAIEKIQKFFNNYIIEQ